MIQSETSTDHRKFNNQKMHDHFEKTLAILWRVIICNPVIGANQTSSYDKSHWGILQKTSLGFALIRKSMHKHGSQRLFAIKQMKNVRRFCDRLESRIKVNVFTRSVKSLILSKILTLA